MTAPTTALQAKLESTDSVVEAAYIILAEARYIARFAGVPAAELGLDIYSGQEEPAWLAEVA